MGLRIDSRYFNLDKEISIEMFIESIACVQRNLILLEGRLEWGALKIPSITSQRQEAEEMLATATEWAKNKVTSVQGFPSDLGSEIIPLWGSETTLKKSDRIRA